MTVTKIKTAERLAPAPKPGSYIHAIYTTIEALGGRARCREIRELLPAANGLSFPSNYECHRHLRSIGVNLGYIGCDVRLMTGTKLSESEYGNVEYYINTFDVYDKLRIERLAKSEKHRKKREAGAKRRVAAAKKQAMREAEQAEMQKVQDRMATARQKLTSVSTTPTKTVAIDPSPKTIYQDHGTRMEYAIVAATASVVSIGVYVLLGQVL